MITIERQRHTKTVWVIENLTKVWLLVVAALGMMAVFVLPLLGLHL